MKGMMLLVLCLLAEAVLGLPSPYVRPSALSTRIVGGQDALPGQFTHVVSLAYTTFGEFEQYCGGSIISEEWVLTGAECDIGKNLDELVVMAGSVNLVRPSKTAQLRYVSKFIKHEKWIPEGTHDIALIKVSEKFILGGAVGKIALPTQGMAPPVGQTCTITGWGVLVKRDHPATSNILQTAKIPVISSEKCHQQYDPLAKHDPSFSLDDTMFCAGMDDGGIDSCTADDGNALNCNNVVHGMSTKGNKCGLPGFAGIYTRVSVYVDWINDVISHN